MSTAHDRIDELLQQRRRMVEQFQIINQMRSSPEATSQLLDRISVLNEQITAAARQADKRD